MQMLLQLLVVDAMPFHDFGFSMRVRAACYASVEIAACFGTFHVRRFLLWVLPGRLGDQELAARACVSARSHAALVMHLPLFARHKTLPSFLSHRVAVDTLGCRGGTRKLRRAAAFTGEGGGGAAAGGRRGGRRRRRRTNGPRRQH